jgi:peptidoglycan/xylan/chitin deacetylase (PgdA/CDA1 family)
MRALTKPPAVLFSLLPSLVWKLPADSRTIYLTFDDGPHPEATPVVLDMLREFQAKATFFCLGKNVERYPEIYRRILDEGHAVGNHSYSHPDGWKTSAELYVQDVKKASQVISSSLFRPPYGRITPAQVKALRNDFKLIMWSVLSKDYELKMTPATIVQNVVSNLSPGSIVVFHDHEKTKEKVPVFLPEILKFCAEKGFVPDVIKSRQ